MQSCSKRFSLVYTGFVLGLRGRNRGDRFDEVRGSEASPPRREYRSGSLRIWSSTIYRSVAEQNGVAATSVSPDRIATSEPQRPSAWRRSCVPLSSAESLSKRAAIDFIVLRRLVDSCGPSRLRTPFWATFLSTVEREGRAAYGLPCAVHGTPAAWTARRSLMRKPGSVPKVPEN